MRHSLPILLLALSGCGASGFYPGVSLVDCPEISREGDAPYSDNAPPTYAAESFGADPGSPLYAPEPVTPSRGGGVPRGPVVR
jgi:hypothetical protein